MGARPWLRAAGVAALALAALLLGAGAAHAHATRSVSIELVEVSPGNATVQVRAELPSDVVRVTVDAPCVTHPAPARPQAAAPASVWRIECPGDLAGATLRVHGLGPIVNHAIVLYTFAGGRTGSAVVRADAPHLELPRAASALDVARSYVGLGIDHILTGYDHLLFLVLLVLCLRDVRAVMLAELAFTLSHSLSYSATVLGLVHLSSAAAEACIALSLILMALEIRPDAPRSALRGVYLAFGFGLVHGLGFAGGLTELGLPDQAAAVALIGFAGGVELGQLIFLGVTLLVFAGVTRLARGTTALRLPRLEPLAIGAIGGVSTYWFSERLLAAFTTST